MVCPALAGIELAELVAAQSSPREAGILALACLTVQGVTVALFVPVDDAVSAESALSVGNNDIGRTGCRVPRTVLGGIASVETGAANIGGIQKIIDAVGRCSGTEIGSITRTVFGTARNRIGQWLELIGRADSGKIGAVFGNIAIAVDIAATEHAGSEIVGGAGGGCAGAFFLDIT